MPPTKSDSGLEQTIVSNAKDQSVTLERKRVLVVDDDPVVRRIIMELLNARYTVVLASTGVQVPELLQKNHPDLIILDVMLPWVNGFELCRIIKTHSEGKEIPVLFLTGCKEKEDIMTGKEVGAAGYLTKPFYAKDLYREVERLLAA